MQLRETQWRRVYNVRRKLPKMHKRFLRSASWDSQSHVLEQDLSRMPPMNRDNVFKIVQRFAATLPYAGYTQGNLYLMYTLGHVFHEECALYWAFVSTVQSVHKYGPSTPYGVHIIPDWVIQYAPSIDRSLCEILIRFRWLYIMFGQTFTSSASILVVWDYCLLGEAHRFSLCAALFARGESVIDFSGCANELERAHLIISQNISSTEEAARVISQAQLLLPL